MSYIGNNNDQSIYEVDFGDGNYYRYSINVMLENLYMKTCDQLESNSILEDDIDHKKDKHDVPKETGWYYLNDSPCRIRVITKRGRNFHVQWTDDLRTWIPLSTIKESNPIEPSQYCKIRKIDDQPAMVWWVDSALKNNERVIKSLHHQIPKKEIKFGV